MAVDVGATLAKLVLRRGDGRLAFRILPSHAIEQAAREVEQLLPDRIGLTGGGALELARLLGLDTEPVGEFAAWRVGSRALLARQGKPPGERDLLVSLGTGTSVLLVEPERATRVGGTALGGGTLLGLGSALVGTADFDEFVTLAAEGDRRKVDLLVSDIYRSGSLPLPGDLNASSFAKLTRARSDAPPGRSDLAHALTALVGENIALICNGLAALTQARRLVFGGATLRNNAALREILESVIGMLGRELIFLVDGEFAGALGALELAAGLA